jgi:exopolyphosphatase/pppGpp-phosphohydrolase
MEGLNDLLNELILSTRMQREKMNGMAPLRIRMIVISALFVKLVLNHCYFDEVKLSRYSLKEGVLFSVLKGNL